MPNFVVTHRTMALVSECVSCKESRNLYIADHNLYLMRARKTRNLVGKQTCGSTAAGTFAGVTAADAHTSDDWLSAQSLSVCVGLSKNTMVECVCVCACVLMCVSVSFRGERYGS